MSSNMKNKLLHINLTNAVLINFCDSLGFYGKCILPGWATLVSLVSDPKVMKHEWVRNKRRLTVQMQSKQLFHLSFGPNKFKFSNVHNQPLYCVKTRKSQSENTAKSYRPLINILLMKTLRLS